MLFYGSKLVETKKEILAKLGRYWLSRFLVTVMTQNECNFPSERAVGGAKRRSGN